MQNSVYYCNKNLISSIPNEDVLQEYSNVTYEQEDLKVIDLKLQIRSHRLIFSSESSHAFLIDCQNIQSVGLSEKGFMWKQYAVKLATKHGKVKIHLKNFNEAKTTIQGALNKKAWKKISEQHKSTELYSGMFNKVQKQKEKINSQGQTVTQSFNSFQNLFGNIKDIKSIMSNMKSKQGTGQDDNQQVNKILKEIGFVSVLSKDQTGNKFINHLATDLYHICMNTLFKTFGGMVPLIDLFYFYNKKRQIQLVSAEELLQACKMFERLGFNAKLVTYSSNIKMLEETSYNAEKDFDTQFSQYFPNFTTGLSAEEVANKKGIPLSIVEIKLRNAAKKGKLAIDDRIEGIKFYKNYFLSL